MGPTPCPSASRQRTHVITNIRMSTLSVRVWRSGADGDGGRFVAYEVPRLPAQTVLDVVTHIQRRIDATLAYRFACRVGMCGSCAMTVNGRARWTCRTHVEAVAGDGDLEIAPLAHLPVIRDLVTDMREFFDKWARAKGQFVADGDAPRRFRAHRAGVEGAPRRGRGDRVHRLRRLLRELRRRRLEPAPTSVRRR